MNCNHECGFYHCNYWETKFGEKIRFCDIKENHLNNIIKMLEKNRDRLDNESPKNELKINQNSKHIRMMQRLRSYIYFGSKMDCQYNAGNPDDSFEDESEEDYFTK